MLVVNSLSVSLEKRRVLDNLSFSIAQGESLCVVGESGSGKTTLLKALLGLLPMSRGEVTQRFENTLFKRDTTSSGIGLPGVSWVMQNPMAALNPLQKVGDSVLEALHQQRNQLSAQQCAERLRNAFAQVRLPLTLAQRFPDQLSLGQAQRICIARALICQPQLVLFDESLSALDAVVQKQIGCTIDEIKHRQGLSYLFVTHDLGFASAYADNILLLKAGKVVAYQPMVDFFEKPQSEYAKDLIEAANILGALPKFTEAEVTAQVRSA